MKLKNYIRKYYQNLRTKIPSHKDRFCFLLHPYPAGSEGEERIIVKVIGNIISYILKMGFAGFQKPQTI